MVISYDCNYLREILLVGKIIIAIGDYGEVDRGRPQKSLDLYGLDRELEGE